MKKKSLQFFIVRVTLLQLFVVLSMGGYARGIEAEKNHLNSLSKLNQQDIIVRGVVKDSKGNTLPGVSVKVKGTNTGAVTDMDGNYTVRVADADAVLVFSYLGFTSQERKVGNSQTISIVLQEEENKLEAVIIVGYGTQKKITSTGAISTIGTKELVQSPVANISNSLVGRLPGLFAVQGSGEPGRDQSTIRIRGIRSFGTGNLNPLYLVDGFEVNDYNSIDPNDVETVTILKDASATAVYGIRGANGVIIITTKRGKLGPPKVSYTVNQAINSFTETGQRTPMESAEYATTFNMALKNDAYTFNGTYTPKFSESDIAKYASGEDPIFYPNVNFFDLILKKNVPQSQHNLNISGGTDKATYFISGSYFNQSGMYNDHSLGNGFDANIRFKRYNFRSNFNYDISPKFRLKFDATSITTNRRGSNANVVGVWNAIARAAPTSTAGFVDGKVLFVTGSNQNPFIDLLNAGYSRAYENNLNGSLRLEHDLDFITKGLSVRAGISYQNQNNQIIASGRAVVRYLPFRRPDGAIDYIPQTEEQPFGFGEAIGKDSRIESNFAFDYKRSFGGHNLSGLVLYNQNKRFDPSLLFRVPRGYQGLVGRTTYNYKERYLADFNMAYTGTENFDLGKRFGFFPAFSVGWVPTAEAFFPENNFVSFIKLRAGYGEVGNDQVGGSRFLFQPTSFTGVANAYTFGDNTGFVNRGGILEGTAGNPDLTWERTVKKNLGLELTLLKEKVKLTADYYTEKTNGILTTPGTVSTINGFPLPPSNLGIMKNGGYEGDISFNDNIGKVNYWVKANMSFARNKVLFRDEVIQPFSYQQQTGLRNGQPFGFVADGYFNSWAEVNDASRPVVEVLNNRLQPGDVKFRDIDGDGRINANDRVPIKDPTFPERIIGFSLGGDFKGFDISALFVGASNVSVTYSRWFNTGFQDNNASTPGYLRNSWTQERYDQGLPIDFPRFSIGNTQTNNYAASTMFTVSASYLRLKNFEIGYTIPSEYLKKVGLRTARIMAQGNNLFTWHSLYKGADPENPNLANGNQEPYPLTRTFNFALNINF